HRLVAYYGNDLRGAQMPFNFALLSTLWSARSIERLIGEYEAVLPDGAWPNWVLGNHDNPRVASRVGRGQARVAAMMLLTLRGTPTMYYGDEIGMTDVPVPPERVRDPFEKNVPGMGLGRDPERSPPQRGAGIPGRAEPFVEGASLLSRRGAGRGDPPLDAPRPRGRAGARPDRVAGGRGGRGRNANGAVMARGCWTAGRWPRLIFEL